MSEKRSKNAVLIYADVSDEQGENHEIQISIRDDGVVIRPTKEGRKTIAYALFVHDGDLVIRKLDKK